MVFVFQTVATFFSQVTLLLLVTLSGFQLAGA
jgi:hypothetical protein